jgi:hypothetical protein
MRSIGDNYSLLCVGGVVDSDSDKAQLVMGLKYFKNSWARIAALHVCDFLAKRMTQGGKEGFGDRLIYKIRSSLR